MLRREAADTDVSNSARCSRKQAGTKQKSVKASSGCRSQLVTAAGDRGDAREELASGILLDFATTKARILDRHEKAICRRPARTADRSKYVAMPLFYRICRERADVQGLALARNFIPTGLLIF